MQGDIVNQGVELMLFGMGTVLVFLTVLVLAITLMSRILQRYFPAVEIAAAPSSAARSATSSVSHPTAIDAGLLVAITTAVHCHRAKHHRN